MSLSGFPGLGDLLAQETPQKELLVKAAFLVKFPLFVEWPGPGIDPQESLVVGFLGNDPLCRILMQERAMFSFNSRPVEFRPLTDLKQVSGCHVVYVAGTARHRLSEMITELARQEARALTVGDFEEFTQEGGMINFVKRDGKVRFEVNLEAVQSSGLKLSPKLLQVSVIKGQSPIRDHP